MSVVVSLLRAIDRAEGEALVMHVGEKPYVVTSSGHAELAAKALTVPAMTGMLEQLLPAESRQALDEVGAVEYHLPPDDEAPGTRYSVVAARGGDDIWIEVRRRKEEPPPPPVEEPIAVTAEHGASAVSSVAAAIAERFEPAAQPEPPPVHFSEPEPVQFAEPEPPAIDEPEPVAFEESVSIEIEHSSPMAVDEQPAVEEQTAVEEQVAVEDPDSTDFAALRVVTSVESEQAIDVAAIAEPEPVVAEQAESPVPAIDPPADERPRHISEMHEPAAAPDVRFTISDAEPQTDQESSAVEPGDRFELMAQAPDDFESAQPFEELEEEPVAFDDAGAALDFTAQPDTLPLAAVVTPMARDEVRVEVSAASTPQPASPTLDPLHHLLKVAAAQGASALYVAPQARPSLRVDGEMRVLDEAPISDAQLEAGLHALMASPSGGAALPLGEFETREIPGVGRVQSLGFRDHRGLGAIFRMLPGRAISAEQAGLSPGIQGLCTEPEGLLLVAGPPNAGKSTLVAALIDQINRTRRDHVITVESEIQFVHENRTSFVSQREARDEHQFLEAVRAAMREAPDVLVIDGVTSAEVASMALHAAANGLVMASVVAPTTSAALERFVSLFGKDADDARAMVSEHLRGVVTQALLRKTGGGRAAAREVLVNVPSVATLIATAQFDQLPGVLNSGRRVGMVPLNDALVGLVQSGALDVRQAFRKSPDQQELIGMLNQAGFDTTFAERLA